jgi:hypothetical protein
MAVLNELLIQPSPLGELFVAARDVAGPASYVTGGQALSPNIFALLSGFKIVLTQGLTQDQLYFTRVYGHAGPTFGGSSNSVAYMKWYYSGYAGSGVTAVTGSGGSGMTVGTYALAFTNTGTGGTGAAGTITVLTATTYSIAITNPGSGYLTAPTVTAATGGTPPTLTAAIGSVAGFEVAAGTNLSTSRMRTLALGN